MKEINRITAAEYMKVFYPSIRNEITELSVQNNFPGIIQVAIDNMKSLSQNSKIQKISISIKRIYWIYKNGNSYIRYIIENLFVRSFESLRKNLQPQQWKFLYQEIPGDFQKIHSSQSKLDKELKY
ncbi:hypothetical protein OF897_15195 [Chryseobacterium formosus]|uniref:DUF7674 domain-containing protein n=1 Tax=Chryseobacterium formosus TaxID=1537363 RepID=A0ABT3XUD9_9FLAO|nr:hypothetical protein [Chryseobacterium formosus]MCX8525265.1 hypothetical protein [Chryseobacterium formosus]